jgi:hypothetical protein
MFFASTNGGGTCVAFPDTCKTPIPGSGVAPIPYPNIGQCSQAKGDSCSSKVKISNKKTLTKKTEIARSDGDQAGVQKGVAQSKQMDKIERTLAYEKVKVEGASIVTMMKTTKHNDGNAPMGMQVDPSQTKVSCMG